MATTDDFFRERFDFECAECGGQDAIDDHASGDKICTSCGLVAESHAIDEHSEWRTFADSDKPGTDMNRVGGPVNHLLSDGGIGSTVIGRATKGDAGGLVTSLNRVAQTGGADRTMVTAFGTISRMCDNLGLPKLIKDLSCELFKRAMDQQLVKGRSHGASCAAVIIIACRQESLGRSFDEVAKVADKCTKKAITKAFKLIMPNVLHDAERKQVAGHPSDYMIRYCSKLGMGAQHQKACQDFVEACIPRGGLERPGRLAGHQEWDKRNPTSIAGAVLYIISNLFVVAGKSSVKVSIEDISSMVSISANTIRAVTKDLQPFLSDLLPSWVAAPEQVKQMVADGYAQS